MKLSKDKALQILATGSSGKICEALLSITIYGKDWKLGQTQCLHFLNHENPDVSGLAASCLGHLARIHPEKIDKDLIQLALKKHLKDPVISSRFKMH